MEIERVTGADLLALTMKSLMDTVFPPKLSIVYSCEINGHVISPAVTANAVLNGSL